MEDHEEHKDSESLPSPYDFTNECLLVLGFLFSAVVWLFCTWMLLNPLQRLIVSNCDGLFDILVYLPSSIVFGRHAAFRARPRWRACFTGHGPLAPSSAVDASVIVGQLEARNAGSIREVDQRKIAMSVRVRAQEHANAQGELTSDEITSAMRDTPGADAGPRPRHDEDDEKAQLASKFVQSREGASMSLRSPSELISDDPRLEPALLDSNAVPGAARSPAPDPDADDRELEQQARAKRASRRETVLFAVTALYLLLLIFLVVPSPNLMLTLLLLLWCLVVWFMCYVWYSSVLMGPAGSGVWLLITTATLVFIAAARSEMAVSYPTCAAAILADAMPAYTGRAFVAPLNFMPWNCLDPEPAWANSRHPPDLDFQRDPIHGWSLLGRLPAGGFSFTARLHCCGQNSGAPVPVQGLITGVRDPRARNTSRMPRLDPTNEPGIRKEDAPLFAPYTYDPAAGCASGLPPPDFASADRMLWPLIAAWLLLAGAWALGACLSWARQHGYCRCLWCPLCRRQYHALDEAPDSAELDTEQEQGSASGLHELEMQAPRP